MKVAFFSLLATGLLSALPEGELESYSRTWTSSDGKELQARLLGVKEGKAALKLESGNVSHVPFSRLSADDQTFLKEEGWPLPKAWRGWPDDLQVTLSSIRIKDLGQREKWFTYQSDHFEVAAEAELGSTCVREICRLLEGVYLLMETSPWGVLATPKDEHFRIELYQTKGSYLKNGGPPNSAGVYLTERAVFMVPFSSLGIEESSAGWRQGKNGSSKTIVHELTHMLMADAVSYLPPWLVEGAAEYMELIPLRTSVFRPGSLEKEIRNHNEYMIERIVGGKPAPLAKVFDLNLYEWQSGGRKRPQPEPTSTRGGMVPTRTMGLGPSSNPVTGFYHSGLLLTYFFIHLDGKGDAAGLQRFIAASQKNSKHLEQFDKDYIAYRQAWKDFAAKPEVEEVAPGSYRFPENLTPPTSPVYPFGNPEDEDIRFVELDVLLEGRTIEEVLDKAHAELEALEISSSR